MAELLLIVIGLFVVVPWLFFRQANGSARHRSAPDEELLDELYDLAERLDARLSTIERIVAAEHPERRRLDHHRSVPNTASYDRAPERRR